MRARIGDDAAHGVEAVMSTDERGVRFEAHVALDQMRIADANVRRIADDRVETREPLVSGAVIRFDGQISVFVPGGPCYACLFKETNEADELCSQLGVLAPVAGIVGCIQATETLKLLLEIGESLVGKLLILDARTMEWRTLKFKRDPACPVCSTH